MSNLKETNERVLITGWAGIVQHIPVSLRTAPCILYYRSLFSIAARNRWKVYFLQEKNSVLIEDDAKGTSSIIASTEYKLPSDTIRPYGRKSKIHLCNIHFTETDYKIILRDTHYSDYIARLEDGSGVYVNGTLDVRYFRSKNLNKTVEFKAYSSYASDAVTDKEHFRDLTWEEGHSYALSLCTKDIFPYKRGMIIDRSASSWYKPNERHPLHWKDEKYFITFSMACNLNLTTLEELNAVNTAIIHCAKQQFGCQHGCTTSCKAVSLKEGRTWVKEILIKLYKEINNGN